MNKKINVICKTKCSSAGGALFFEGEKYICEIVGKGHFITDKKGNILRLENDNINKYGNLQTYFYTEKEARKLKLKKLNNANK